VDRYCATCQFDFDPGTHSGGGQAWPAADASHVDGIPGVIGPTRRSRIAFGIVAVVVIAALVLEASGVITGGGASGRAPSGDLPPAGSIWFGSTFDRTTFVLGGRTTIVGTDAPFSFVARLTRSTRGSEMAMRWSRDGSLATKSALGWDGEGEVWGGTTGPLSEAGDWRLELTDLDGNTLASGTLVVTGGRTAATPLHRACASCVRPGTDQDLLRLVGAAGRTAGWAVASPHRLS
jgi:hypothetical protein